MKNIVLSAFTAMLLFFSAGCSSEHYVSAQPDAVVVTRPVQPRPNYVWVDGNYYWRGGRYVYRNGYWAAPRRGGVWHPGGWVSTPRGYYWRRGRW